MQVVTTDNINAHSLDQPDTAMPVKSPQTTTRIPKSPAILVLSLFPQLHPPLLNSCLEKSEEWDMAEKAKMIESRHMIDENGRTRDIKQVDHGAD